MSSGPTLVPGPERDRPAAVAEGGAGIVGLGIAVPDRVVPSAEVEARLGVDRGWIAGRTGVRQRRMAAPGDTLTAIASAAGAEALERAGVDAGELDLVLVATMTADDLIPNAAPLVAAQLGATRAGAFDVGAACAGFLSGLALAAAQVEAGRAGSALVIGADLMSRVVDADDRSTAGLFGDGAGAAVVSAGGSGLVGPVVFGADAGREHIYASHADRTIRMDGRPTFRAAVARLSEVSRDVATAAGIALSDVDLFVYHQANRRILGAVGERLGLPADRVVDCIERYGNTSAASVPIALDDAVAAGRLQPGMTVLLGAFGAGFVWAGALLRWGEEP